jgi:hypothetical protein
MRNQRKCYVYTAYSMHYKYSTVVYATSVKQARQYGYLEAKRVMGSHARIARDDVHEHT